MQIRLAAAASSNCFSFNNIIVFAEMQRVCVQLVQIFCTSSSLSLSDWMEIPDLSSILKVGAWKHFIQLGLW